MTTLDEIKEQTPQSVIDMLHGTARLHVHLAKMDGWKLDKKICRFNDIVETALRFCAVRTNPNLSRDFTILVEGLFETVAGCFSHTPWREDNPFHLPSGPLADIPDWMILVIAPITLHDEQSNETTV